MTTEKIEKNYDVFVEKLETYFGEETAKSIIEEVGGKEKLENATFASNVDSGLAYDGSLIETILKLITYAYNINSLIPATKQATKEEIVRVGLLSHLAKCLMFEPNDNNWEVTNRGLMYKFAQLDGALRLGERSILIAMNAGVKLTPNEFEAMRILDKTTEDDKFTKYYSSTLSTVIRQANEIINLINKI